MRRWRPAAALLTIGMIFWVGSATSTPVSAPDEPRLQALADEAQADEALADEALADEAQADEAQADLAPVTVESLPPFPPWPDGCWSATGGDGCRQTFTEEPDPNTEEWRPEIESPKKTLRSLIEEYFRPGDVGRALRIVDCESGGNPRAVNSRSGAAGLFQHLPRYWKARAASAGFAGASPLDSEANVATSAWLVYHGGGWSHWDASARCWR